MDYIERERSLIDNGALQVAPMGKDRSLLSELADALMDGCAEELAGIDPTKLNPECASRVERVLAAIRGVGLPQPSTLPTDPVRVSYGAL